MQIDWITVSAQIVNFLVLVWLLQRFLYRPVMQAMQRREERIAGRLHEAEEREREAEDRARQFDEKTAELDGRREELLAEAREAAERQRRQLVDDARGEVDAQRRQWQEQVERERQAFAESLRRRAGDSVQRIARQALRDLADTGLEAQIVDNFVARLAASDADIREAMADGDGPLRIRTAFDLAPAVRSRLTRAVHERIGADIDVEYDADEALLCGIEMRRADRRLGWSLADYLDEIAERVDEAFRPVATRRQGD